MSLTVELPEINIKEDVILKLRNESTEERVIHIPFNHLKDYMRSACNACSDFTNIYADISFGGLGSPDKYTTVITRTEKGQKVLNEVRNEKVIKCLDLDGEKRKKMLEKITQFSQSKINRRENFMKNIS